MCMQPAVDTVAREARDEAPFPRSVIFGPPPKFHRATPVRGRSLSGAVEVDLDVFCARARFTLRTIGFGRRRR